MGLGGGGRQGQASGRQNVPSWNRWPPRAALVRRDSSLWTLAGKTWGTPSTTGMPRASLNVTTLALMGALMRALMGAARGERPNVAARRRVSDGAVSAAQALHAPVIREDIGGISVWVPMMYDLAGHKLEQGVQGRFRGAEG